MPQSKGGSNKAFNIVPACFKCNQEKANKLPTCSCDKCQNALKVWGGRKKVRKVDTFCPVCNYPMSDWNHGFCFTVKY